MCEKMKMREASHSGGRKSAKPEAGPCLAFSRNREEASTARAKCARWRILPAEFREELGTQLVLGFVGQ